MYGHMKEIYPMALFSTLEIRDITASVDGDTGPWIFPW